jgi:transposase
VIQHHRKKYACDDCEEHVAIAAKPPQPILPGPGLLAQTVLSKYGDYLPLYRQEDILSRSGIIIRRSTLCDWVASAADLLKPLYDLMGDRVRASHVIHTDDTGIKMLDVGQCRNCKFWAAVQWCVGAAAPHCHPSGSSNKPASPAGRMPVIRTIRTRSTNSV